MFWIPEEWVAYLICSWFSKRPLYFFHRYYKFLDFSHKVLQILLIFHGQIFDVQTFMIYCPKLISWQSMKHTHSMLTLPINLMILRRLVNKLGYILLNNIALSLWKLATVELVKPICCNWNFCSTLNTKESDVSKNDTTDCFFWCSGSPR